MIKDPLEVEVQLENEGPPGKIGKMGPVGSSVEIGARGEKGRHWRCWSTRPYWSTR